MRYVLSEAELKRMVPAVRVAKLQEAIEWMRKRIALRCIYTGHKNKYSYCDECPLGRLDDDGPPKDLRDLLCAHQRSYSK